MRSRTIISVPLRVTISLVLLSMTTLMLARMVLGNSTPHRLEIDKKTSLCESMAISCSILAERSDIAAIDQNISAVMDRNAEIASVCLRENNGDVLATCGDHAKYWAESEKHQMSTRDNITVPILNGGQQWGALEISFQKPYKNAVISWLMQPTIRLALATVLFNAIFFRWYIGKILTYLNPAEAVPEHVRSTIDTFAEGVAVLDDDNRIVLANSAFAKQIEINGDGLVGHSINSFPWKLDDKDTQLPWHPTNLLADASQSLTITTPGGDHRTFLVNASPIRDDNGKQRGTIVSFDDITIMERRREELRIMLSHLQASREELTVKNQELQILATRDSLTGCLNRRIFFELFNKHWQAAERNETSLSCAMVDIDFFKSINDNHGHQMGDEVLKAVAACLQKHAEPGYIPCRYGGEEFAFLLPGLDIEAAAGVAEQIRQGIAALQFDELSITASVGVSSIALGPEDPDALLDQADKCLYIAKRNGRNQIVRWDQAPRDLEVDQSQISRTQDEEAKPQQTTELIAHEAVNAVLTALSFRFPAEAKRAARVAEYAATLANGLLSAHETYLTEIAALLMNVGKLGMPDEATLALQDDPRAQQLEDQIGLEMVEAALNNVSLIRIIRASRYAFAPSDGDMQQAVVGKEIPMPSRILAIADAFSKAPNASRSAHSNLQQGFLRLQEAAGTRFDPQLVERFLTVMKGHKPSNETDTKATSRASALHLAANLEALAVATDGSDRHRIAAQLEDLKTIAEANKLDAIATMAVELRLAIDNNEPLSDLLPILQDLLAIGRMTQRTSLTSTPLDLAKV